MFTRGSCKSVQQRAVDRVEEIDPLDGLVVDPSRAGEAVERADAGGEVVERG
jgi:hypothetical protein